jgi:hypothetical protein
MLAAIRHCSGPRAFYPDSGRRGGLAHNISSGSLSQRRFAYFKGGSSTALPWRLTRGEVSWESGPLGTLLWSRPCPPQLNRLIIICLAHCMGEPLARSCAGLVADPCPSLSLFSPVLAVLTCCLGVQTCLAAVWEGASRATVQARGGEVEAALATALSSDRPWTGEQRTAAQRREHHSTASTGL